MRVIEASRRFACRLNLRHKWATFHNEDGQRYQRCVRCGKDQGIRGMPYPGQDRWVDNG